MNKNLALIIVLSITSIFASSRPSSPSSSISQISKDTLTTESKSTRQSMSSNISTETLSSIVASSKEDLTISERKQKSLMENFAKRRAFFLGIPVFGDTQKPVYVQEKKSEQLIMPEVQAERQIVSQLVIVPPGLPLLKEFGIDAQKPVSDEQIKDAVRKLIAYRHSHNYSTKYKSFISELIILEERLNKRGHFSNVVTSMIGGRFTIELKTAYLNIAYLLTPTV